MSKPLAWTVWSITLMLLGCFFVWPLVSTVQRAFFDANGHFTVSYVAEVFKNRTYTEALRNSFLLGIATTGVTILGLLTPGNTIDWLGNGQFWGVVAIQALNLCPILFLNLSAALANVDPAMEEAASNLGCTGFRR